MFDGTLATTNLLLGILTMVSVAAAIAFVAALIALVRLAREVSELVRDLRQQLTTLSARIDGVGQSLEGTIEDVQKLTQRATMSAERAHLAFDTVASVATLALTAGGTSLATRVTRMAGFARAFNGVYRMMVRRWRRGGSHTPMNSTNTMKEVTVATS
jgi:uncharacterized protein YoxC